MISEGSCDTEDRKFSFAITIIFFFIFKYKTVSLNCSNITILLYFIQKNLNPEILIASCIYISFLHFFMYFY